MSDTLAKRALVALLKNGPLSAAEASLYPRVLPAMVADGLARKTADGGYELATTPSHLPSSPSVPPPSVMPAAPMPTISARVTFDDIAFLEELERSRSLTRADAIRFILERARTMGARFVGSGAMRKAGGQ